MEADEIAKLRKQLGWSLADFARYFGVTPQAVFKWEKGTAQPSDLALAAMVQLRSRLDAAKERKQKQQFINGLKHALLTGGIVALLAYLFNSED